MKNCEKHIEMISSMLDGELSAEEESRLHAHLEECEDCRRVYRAFASLSEAVRDSAAEPPEALSRGIMFKIGLQSGRKTGRRFAYGKFTAIAACAAILIVAASGIGRGDMFDLGKAESVSAPGAAMQESADLPVADSTYYSAEFAQAENTQTSGAAEAPEAAAGAVKGDAASREEPARQPTATVFVAEAELFNASLMNMTSADIFDSEPALQARSPLLTVTEEAGLQFLAEMLTIYRLEDILVPEEAPLCVIGVSSGEEYYTVTVWIIDGSIIGRDDSTGTLYMATGAAEDVENLLELVPAA